VKFLAFEGKLGGHQPEWYRHLVAAEVLGVAPWELAPAHRGLASWMGWREWALARRIAENRAEALMLRQRSQDS
jgi:hypothetical protein